MITMKSHLRVQTSLSKMRAVVSVVLSGCSSRDAKDQKAQK